MRLSGMNISMIQTGPGIRLMIQKASLNCCLPNVSRAHCNMIRTAQQKGCYSLIVWRASDLL